MSTSMCLSRIFSPNSFPEMQSNKYQGRSQKRLSSMGFRLRFLKRGEGGDPALPLHGFGGDLNNWSFNQHALAQERAVYVLGSARSRRLCNTDRVQLPSRFR